MSVAIKRVYEDPSPDDGYRVLVDHIWPRGVSKEKAAVDEWMKEIAPSDGLRKWYGHEPERFEEFERRYKEELGGKRDLLSALRRRSRREKVTLVFAARAVEGSNAVVLAAVLRGGLR